jgi:flagellar hook-associated protein 2
VTIPAGTYNTPGELIAAIQKAINTAQASPDNFVTVGQDVSGKLQFTTNKFGAGASVEITGATVNGAADAALFADLGFTGTASGSGTDVAGNFVVNGQTEAGHRAAASS